MNIRVCESRDELGRLAAAEGGAALREALGGQQQSTMILATGQSQFEVLSSLAREKDIDWGRVTIFHLDEYAGLPVSHPASFRKYLLERFVEKLPTAPAAFVQVNGEADLEAECARLSGLIAPRTVDVAFIGIGENGHLAFNDPPADFETTLPYIVVDLDEACRRQQLGEGWFPTLEDVPKRAISMSIRQILKSKQIVCSVPDERKAVAVRSAVDGTVTPNVPASILQRHPATTLYLDGPSASLLAP